MECDDPTDRTIAALRQLAEAPADDDAHDPIRDFTASIELSWPAVAALIEDGCPVHELPPGLIEAIRISNSHRVWYARDLENSRLDLALMSSRLRHGLL